MARANAQSDYAAMVAGDYPGYRRVQVWMKEPWPTDDRLKKFATALAAPDACYRLIFASDKALLS